MSLKRTFLKNAVINLLEADGFDGALLVDSPTFFVKQIRLDAEVLKVFVDIRFTVQQGSLNLEHQRTLEIDYTSLPQVAKDEFKGTYDFVVNNLPTYTAKLGGSVEQ